MALLLAVGLPIAGTLLRHGRQDQCALDGCPILPIFRVKIVAEDENMAQLCCVQCAELWVKCSQSKPRAIIATDEATGQELDVDRAVFVRSSVVVAPGTGCRLHMFRDRSDADRHAATFGGTVLQRHEQPFQGRT